ncbi:hypothetical protein FHR83_002956 [Actinoplanes campanulatus]|uniref:Uncharacterized protein n=1 Tax=Actinoplanes campanulatus TaxID=113559 RepID=A0A7W5AFD9_9ACTN|nr:hypothetical protein [Actinoplanes campanulatus]MBB3095293.1 hypothetical protein [Actinoplanes campanulatus]GGN41343.1 hypothetical protein GCM10010109_71380 [Actinoplanes campanulatus]GID34897.1 hypothetical protein Aca09nite_14030 [Actinoplanes campanulatus]
MPITQGEAPGQPSLDWLDLLPADPLVALDRFVTGWFADEPPGVPASWGPPSLREFHRIAAGRDAVHGQSAKIAREPFGDPRPDGLIPFGHESDGVFRLLLDPSEPDPPVFYDYDGDLVPERDRLSAFLLHFVLARAALDGPVGGFALCTAEEATRMTAGLTRVPLRPLSWPGVAMHTYAGPGLVIHTGPQDDSGDHHEFYVGARHRALLRPLRPHNPVWEVFHD